MVIDGVITLGVQPVRHPEEEGVRDGGEDMVFLLQEFVTFFNQNWTSARRNQMEASMVENIGNLKWWMARRKAAGEEVSAGKEASVLAGIMKVRYSAPGLPMQQHQKERF